ncbi:MAG: Ig-like domain-containing protein [Gemmatimonadota bacterium]
MTRRLFAPRGAPLAALAPLLLLAACGDGPTTPGPADTTAPAVVLASPASDTVYVTRVGAPRRPQVEGTATDAVGVARLTYQLDGGQEVEVAITPGATVPYSFPVRLAEGANTLVVHAYDAAGNRGSSAARRLGQNSEGPRIRLLSPDTAAVLLSDTVRVTLSAADAFGLTRARVRVNYGPYRDVPLSGDSAAFTLEVPLQGGENGIDVEVFDRDDVRGWWFYRLRRGGLAFRAGSAGRSHTCALSPAGAAYCWAPHGSYGETGQGEGDDARAPSPVVGGHVFRQVEAGVDQSCGVATDGRLFCWGRDYSRRVGVGAGSYLVSVPVQVGGGTAFRSVTLGPLHVCAVSTADEAYCWGRNPNGELGIAGNAPEAAAPTPVAGGIAFRSLSAGSGYTCGLTPAGRAYCWGSNASGQLGTGEIAGTRVPAPVAGGLAFRSLAAGVAHTCAVATDGRAWCWGSNLLGELGTGEYQQGSTPARAPVAVKSDARFASVVAGSRHACALAEDGSAWCWGDNAEGQLGTGTAAGSAAPVRVAGGHTFRSLSARDVRTCGTTTGDRLLCWGDRTLAPTPVAGQQ